MSKKPASEACASSKIFARLEELSEKIDDDNAQTQIVMSEMMRRINQIAIREEKESKNEIDILREEYESMKKELKKISNILDAFDDPVLCDVDMTGKINEIFVQFTRHKANFTHVYDKIFKKDEKSDDDEVVFEGTSEFD